jgi:hypothetical protein
MRDHLVLKTKTAGKSDLTRKVLTTIVKLQLWKEFQLCCNFCICIEGASMIMYRVVKDECWLPISSRLTTTRTVWKRKLIKHHNLSVY